MNTLNGYSKIKLTNDYILTAAGGHLPLEVPSTGGTSISSNISWSAKVLGNTWSRLCFVTYKTVTTGATFIINIRATRSNVIYNNTYLVTAHHLSRGHVVQLAGSNYSSVSVRVCANKDGSCYFELKDSAKSIASTSTQYVGCSLIPIACGEITTYTVFTNGTTLDSGYTAGTILTSQNYDNSIQASNFVGNFVGNLVGNALTANKWSTARNLTLSGLLQGSVSLDGSADVTLSGYNYYSLVSIGGTNNYPYHKIISSEVYGAQHMDLYGLYRITKGYSDPQIGVFLVNIRTGYKKSDGSDEDSLVYVQWLYRKGISADSILYTFNKTLGNTYIDVFYKSGGGWTSAFIELISNVRDRYLIGRCFTLLNSRETTKDVKDTTTGKISTVVDTANTTSYAKVEAGQTNALKQNALRSFTNSLTSAVDAGTIVHTANHAININVAQHTSNNIEHPLVWCNQASTTSNSAQLYKSYPDLTYNPSKKSITATLFKGAVGDETCTIKPERSNEINFGGTSTTDTVYFGFSSIDSRPIPTKYVFGNSTTGTATLVAAQLRASSVASSRGVLTINGQGGIYFKYNDTNSQSMTLNGSAFKPFNDANGKLSLGTADARWNGVYTSGAINSNLSTNTYLAGNLGKAIINSTAAGANFKMLAKMNSTNGYFMQGAFGNEYAFYYTAKTTVDAETNGFTKKLSLLNESGNTIFPGNVTGTGFIKNSSSDSYVLLGGGGHKTISSLSVGKATNLANKYSSRPTSVNPEVTGDGSMFLFKSTSSVTDETSDPGDGHILHFNWDNAGKWDTLLYLKCHGDEAKIRGMNGTGWNAWNTLLSSNNYTSYIDNYLDGTYYAVKGLPYLASADWNWDNITDIGTYKIQSGKTITNHPKYNGTNGAYPFGLATVIKGISDDSENRTVQIYFPHQWTTLRNIPLYLRMKNNNTWTNWVGVPSADSVVTLTEAQTITGAKTLYTTASNGITIKRNNSGAGAWIAYCPNNLDTDYWMAGSNAAKLFAFAYKGSEVGVRISSGGLLQAPRFESTVSTGTAPFIVKSTTLVPNLNATYLEGLKAAHIAASELIFNDVFFYQILYGGKGNVTVETTNALPTITTENNVEKVSFTNLTWTAVSDDNKTPYLNLFDHSKFTKVALNETVQGVRYTINISEWIEARYLCLFTLYGDSNCLILVEYIKDDVITEALNSKTGAECFVKTLDSTGVSNKVRITLTKRAAANNIELLGLSFYTYRGGALGVIYNHGITQDGFRILRPINTRAWYFGSTSYRWANIYSTLGNFAGEVTSLTSDTNAVGFTAKNNNGSVKLLAQTNRGVYDATKESWMIYSLKDSLEVYIPRWANKGNVITPIYFNGSGMPAVCALDTKYVISGAYDNKDFASFYDRSFIGSINATAASSPTAEKAWFNTIQIAHRNGETDGPDYVSQIAIEMATGNKDRMWFRGSRKGSWVKVLSTANSSISDYAVKINNTTKNFVRDWGSGAVNMNDVARGGRSSMGMASLSTPEGGTATAINPNGATNWHHFINISYTSNGSGNNTWITQIANKAGTTDLWVRSRNGGTISDTAAWTAGWTRILTGTNYTLVLDSVYQAKGTYLTSHQTIYNLTMLAGAFSAVTFDPNGAAKTVNIPTKTSHLTNDSGFITATGATKIGMTSITTYADLAPVGVYGYTNTNSNAETNGFNLGNSSAAIGWGKDNCKILIAARAGKTDSEVYIKLYYLSWGNWYQLIHSGNYTSYTVKKDGTGATGTWGINVTGSAGSVAWSNVTSKPTLTNVSYTAATANIDHPILFANNSTATSTPTTGAVYYEANSTAGTGLTYNPSTNTIKMPDGGIITTTGTNAITLKLGRIEARTSSTDNTYSAGTSGLVLKTNGNNVYWANDNNSNSWRAIKVGNTSIAGTGTNTYALKFVQGTGITITGASGSSTTDNSITITNSGVRSVTTGDNNGTIKVNTGGTSTNVSVKGLGSNAYTSTAYLPLSGGTMTGSIYMGTNNYIYGANESSGAMLFFDGKKTIIGSIGASTTEYTLIRSKDSIVKIGSYTALHSGNSEVSGGGSSLGSSITVKINGTSKTLTIPSIVDKANGINLTNLVTGAPTNPIKVWVGTANLYTKATKDSSTLYFIY